MSYKVLSGSNPSATFSNNCRRLWIVFTPETPVSVPLGQEFDISLLFPGASNAVKPGLTLNLQTEGGTYDIMDDLELSILSSLYGLEGDKAAYIKATSVQPERTIDASFEGEVPETEVDYAAFVGTTQAGLNPVLVDFTGNLVFPATGISTTGQVVIPQFTVNQQIESISFAVDVFPLGRKFSNNDLMTIEVTGMQSGANIDVYVSDSAYMTPNDLPYYYRTRTVQAQNDLSVDFVGTLIFPNDANKVKSIQFAGNNYVQWDLIDFFANAKSDWVTNKTTFNSSPYIFLNTKEDFVNNVKFKANTQDFKFYFKDLFKKKLQV